MQHLIKRIADLFLSLFLLILLSPLFLIIAFVIKTTSKGPVFFKQERVGKNRRLFMVWKFRTMIHPAPSLPIEKVLAYELHNNDPRIIKGGKFLRKYYFDELPQLINVLRGEMSLVGPRPFFLPRLNNNPRLKDKRLSVLPGMTGLSQVYVYQHKKIDDEIIIKLDEEYLERWNLWLDLKIILTTIDIIYKKVILKK